MKTGILAFPDGWATISVDLEGALRFLNLKSIPLASISIFSIIRYVP